MKPFDYATYGQPGSPVPGSRFVRGYCPICGAPVRTSQFSPPQACSACDGHELRGGRGAPIDDVTGYQANAIRALEN